MDRNFLAAVVRDLNGLPFEGDDAYAALVSGNNERVARAAAERLTIDSVPWSFETFRSQTAADGGAES
jgi:hypothetical protein